MGRKCNIHMLIFAVLNIFITRCHGGLNIPARGCRAYVRKGDINIGVLVGIHSNRCRDFQQVHMQTVEGIVHAVNAINNDSRILPNVTLGFVIQDDCSETSVALACSVNFAPAGKPTDTCSVNTSTPQIENTLTNRKYRVAGVVGPVFSKQAVMVSSFLDLYEIPVIGVLTSSDELSDKSRYEYFLRLAPPDHYSIVALVTALEQFNWTYVSMVYSEGSFGENAAKHVAKLLKIKSICMAYSGMLPIYASKNDIQTVVENLIEQSKARVVIIFLDSHEDKLFQEVLDRGWVDHFIWIGQLLPFNLVTEILPHLLLFAFPTAHFSQEFKNSFLSMTKINTNPWFREFWMARFNCQWEDSGKQDHCSQFSTVGSISDLDFNTFFPRYVDGVWTMALALDALFRKDCPDAFIRKDQMADCIQGFKLLQHLRNVSFTGLSGHVHFDEYGDIQGQVAVLQYDKEGNVYQVGDWDEQKKELIIKNITWNHMTCTGANNQSTECVQEAIPESVCSRTCGPKQFYHYQELQCCWECKFCRDNEVIINTTSCIPCPLFTWPEETEALLCIEIEAWAQSWGHPAVLGLTVLATIGVILSCGMTVFYVTQRKLKLIKASSLGLSMMSLTGLCLAYVIIFTLLSTPSDAVCVLNRLGFSMAVTITYGPLLVKTNRVYRIFSSGKHGNRRPLWISSRSQGVFSILLIIAQLLLSTILLILYPTMAGPSQPVPTEKFVELLCYVPLEGMLVPFLFNAVLICSCAVYGFLTRRLPENFNESWYLFIAVSTTLFLWLAFLPTYFAAFYAYHQTLLMCSVMLLTATIILCCLFVPKVYAVFYVDETQQRVLNPSLISATAAMPGQSTVTSGTSTVPPGDQEQP